MPPLADWYHCMTNTYGTWLPGDGRGFRTRYHKEHVPYDYHNRPPKGMYDGLYRSARDAMKRAPVYLRNADQRRRACDEFVASLARHGIEVAVVSVDRVHLHVLARFPDHDPRRWVGLAKKESSHYCKQAGLAPAGGIWAAACECIPISEREHYDNALGYIADHETRGSAVWRKPPGPDLSDFDPNDLLIE